MPRDYLYWWPDEELPTVPKELINNPGPGKAVNVCLGCSKTYESGMSHECPVTFNWAPSIGYVISTVTDTVTDSTNIRWSLLEPSRSLNGADTFSLETCLTTLSALSQSDRQKIYEELYHKFGCRIYK